MGVASLVLGIASIVLGFIPGLNTIFVPTILGIVGIILGALARKNNPMDGMAKGGLVCSIIGTVLSLLVWIACLACYASAASAVSGLSSAYYY